MADGEDERAYGGGPGRTPGGGWVPVPDPTTLTTEAVERATGVFRRELQALRETLETRLDAADADRTRIWERLRDLPALYEVAASHLRDEMIQRDEHTREVITQRLNDLDAAASVAAGHIEKIPVDLTGDFRKALHAEREYLTSQLDIVRAIMTEKFTAVDGRFGESKVAVDAAFSAAKEAVAEQNRSNDRAITIAQSGTKEQLTALSSVTDAGLGALTDKITDARDRLTAIENLTRGIKEAGGEGRESRTEQKLGTAQVLQTAALIIVGLGVVISVIALILHK